ncbi:MAG: sugar phosphate nucleotidyltransferase, partial [Patescibacteria group bacterium]
MKIIILAGGGGTRLWPLSRKNLPKQFTPIIGDRILLQETIDRFFDYPAGDIFVSLTAELLPLFQEKVKNFPAENIIIEPAKRDTGPAMGFVALVLAEKFPDEPMAFIPSDHYIGDVKKFLNCLKVGERLIKAEGRLLDIAVTANYPSTVLGYTRIGEKYLDEDGVEVYNFKGHVEKPNLEKAQEYLAEGDYLWHASYYMWTPAKFLAAYEAYAPAVYTGLMKVKVARASDDQKLLAEEYSRLEKISIDYAVTEKMDPKNVLIIKGDFGWSDIGAWDVLFDKLKGQADANGNLIKAEWLGLDTKNCLIYGPAGKMIATIGVEDLAIV